MQTETVSMSVPIIAAITGAVIGSICAFIWQRRSAKHADKKAILGTLMAYRGWQGQNEDFVKAVNMVDIYFYDSKKVRTICHEYFKNLRAPYFGNGDDAISLRSLLLAMAQDIGYTDLKADDIEDFYHPIAYTTNPTSPETPKP